MATLNKLYEGIDLQGYTPKEIQDSKKVYNYLLESIELAQKENKPADEVMDEGLLTGLIGGAISATVGKSIVEAILKAIGISKGSVIYNCLTSKMVLAGIGYELGYRW